MVLGSFILVALAVARATRLVTVDQITVSFRRWVVNKFGEESGVAYLVHCRACSSLWISAPASAMWTMLTLPLHLWWVGLAAWFAFSQLTILLARLEEE